MVLHKTDGRRTTDEVEEKESEKTVKLYAIVPIYENDVESEARITLEIMVIF